MTTSISGRWKRPRRSSVLALCLASGSLALALLVTRQEPTPDSPERAATGKRSVAVLGDDIAPGDRRDLLNSIADRTAATPGRSDLDVLIAVVARDVLLLAAAEDALNLLTEDLILLFTDRAPDGISPSDAPYYRPGRCGDVGFMDSLRDGSDQVRHVCWALRMFTVADDLEQTQGLLHLKELSDAVRRSLPLNEADLALNRAAREVVEEIRGETLPLATWPELLRRKLGG